MKKFVFTVLALLTAGLIHAQAVQIRKGNSGYTSDCIFTYQNGKIYKGTSTYTSDCLMNFSGNLPHAVVVWLSYYCYRGYFL